MVLNYFVPNSLSKAYDDIHCAVDLSDDESRKNYCIISTVFLLRIRLINNVKLILFIRYISSRF